MPWLLQTELDDLKALHYWETISEDGQKYSFEPFGNWRVPVKPEDLPIHLRLMTGSPANTYDIMQGPGSTWFVSVRLKNLFEKYDKQCGTFFPVVLATPDGVLEGTHFWQRMTGLVSGGIELDESDAEPAMVAGKIAFYSTSHSPTIVWHDKAISGRHVWADEYLRNRLFVSDEVLAAMSDQGMTGFKTKKSPLSSKV